MVQVQSISFNRSIYHSHSFGKSKHNKSALDSSAKKSDNIKSWLDNFAQNIKSSIGLSNNQYNYELAKSVGSAIDILESDSDEINKLNFESIFCNSGFQEELLNKMPNIYNQIVVNDKKVIRKTKLLNRFTNSYVDAYILKDKSGRFEIHTANEQHLGMMILHDPNDDCGKVAYDAYAKGRQLKYASKEYRANKFLEIHKLETANLGINDCKYRGIGTELVKQAVIESYKKGYFGRISCTAANYLHQGREASGFYEHIGMKNVGNHTPVYVLPEDFIADFLLK